MEQTATIRVLMVDDHRVFRQGLRALIAREPGIEVVGEAESGEEAVPAVIELKPDVVLLDISMPGIDGVETTRRILAQRPGTGIVILTADQGNAQVFGAIKNGARGYVLKSAGAAEVIRAIRSVRGGEASIDPGVSMRLLDEFARVWPAGAPAPDGLTEREVLILKLIAGGRGNKEIAAEIGLSEHRVKNLITAIFQKLGLSTRTQAGIYAIQHGLVEGNKRNLADGSDRDT